MKFLVIAPRFHTNLYYRVIALQNAGHTVKVAVLYKGKSEYYENIDIKKLKLPFFTKLASKIISFFTKNHLKSRLELRIQAPGKDLRKIINEYKPDVILLNAYQNMLAIKTLLVTKLRKIKKLMLTQTNFTHIKGSRFLFKLNILLFKFLNVHASITPIKANFDAFKNFGIENVFYLPFVFPAVTFQAAIESKKDRFSTNNSEIKIISIGKFVKRKDQLLLIKAVSNLIDLKYNLKLNVFGEKADENYFNEISTFIKNNNLSENIKLLTNVSYQSILKEYTKHDIFVLPSYAEPAAYSPVEALSNGLPVICSDQNGTKCYIEAGINGYVFEAKNLISLTNKIKLLISDLQNLQIMSENALNLAIKNHSIESFKNKIFQIKTIKTG